MLVITVDTYFFAFECWLSFVFSGFEPFCKQFMFLLCSNKCLRSASTSEQRSDCRKALVVYYRYYVLEQDLYGCFDVLCTVIEQTT